jgi:hypothetical protein
LALIIGSAALFILGVAGGVWIRRKKIHRRKSELKEIQKLIYNPQFLAKEKLYQQTFTQSALFENSGLTDNSAFLTGNSAYVTDIRTPEGWTVRLQPVLDTDGFPPATTSYPAANYEQEYFPTVVQQQQPSPNDTNQSQIPNDAKLTV